MWFQTGVIPPAGTYEKYWADPYTLFFIEVIAFQFAELRRWQDYRKPGSMGKQYFLGLEEVLKGSGDPAYPGHPHCCSLKSLEAPPPKHCNSGPEAQSTLAGGQFFNLFGLGKSNMKELQTKEIKNGRLAMYVLHNNSSQCAEDQAYVPRCSVLPDMLRVTCRIAVWPSLAMCMGMYCTFRFAPSPTDHFGCEVALFCRSLGLELKQ